MPRPRLPLLMAAVAVALVTGGFAAFQLFLAGDNVPRLTLPPVTAEPATTGASLTPSGTAVASPAAILDPSPAGLAGTWTVGDGSVAGYRVREQLGGISALTEAVGRTNAITGSATFEASGDSIRVSAATFEADLSQLTSDDGRRDNRIRSIGLESTTFPTATFVLAEAIDVPAGALDGSPVEVVMNGDLAIHGVTKRVAIPAQAQLNGDRIEIVGSLTFPFSDFAMTPPDIANFVQVEDDATLEVLVSLVKA